MEQKKKKYIFNNSTLKIVLENRNVLGYIPSLKLSQLSPNILTLLSDVLNLADHVKVVLYTIEGNGWNQFLLKK